MNDYNTVKEKLILKEYGRNVQNLVKFLNTIEDKEERSKKAATLTEIMKQVNANIKDAPEVEHKLWDDIHIISDFKINVDGDFPTPSEETVYKKPSKLEYNKNKIIFKHLGKNIELFIDKACQLEDPEEREAAIIHIGKLMKTFYYSYSTDNIEDRVIYQNIQKLSDGKLEIDLEKVTASNLFEPQRKERRYTNSKDKRTPDRNRSKNNSTNSNSNNNRRNFKKARN